MMPFFTSREQLCTCRDVLVHAETAASAAPCVGTMYVLRGPYMYADGEQRSALCDEARVLNASMLGGR